MNNSPDYTSSMPSHRLTALLCLSIVIVARLPAVAADCQRNCGAVEIPYPFGVGEPDSGCSRHGFELSCNHTGNGVYKPFYHDVELLDILLLEGQVRMRMDISYSCYSASSEDNIQGYNWWLNLTGTPYRFSDTGNKFTVVGCRTLAYIADDYNVGKYMSGCVAVCRRGDVTTLTNGSCSGIGCCQTAIPKGLQYYGVSFDSGFNTTEIHNISRCSYAALVETSHFTFSTNYATSSAFNDTYGGQAPLLVDWAVGNETCEVARQKPDYACVNSNSECFNSPNGHGYICNCSEGFHGNPYLPGPDGCQDINECMDHTKYPCYGTCDNKPGRFDCFCPSGTRGNASIGPCEKELTQGEQLTIGICACLSVGLSLFLGIEWIKYKRRTIREDLMRKRDAYFHQHGGQLLTDMMRIESNISFKLFGREEIESATNNFNEREIIGEGGQGTVYKGYDIDPDNNPVAIKKFKQVDESSRLEFGQELHILSRVNHENIVKIIGCCLQFEVPVLVYQFVPNKTLHYLIHAQSEASIRTLEIRLKIAAESAEALTYLHSMDYPILHGDVKSANILLGDNFDAKVADFGCSMIRAAGENANVVKGTIGYLDPEYLLEFQLTDKSDVYSFGVVLLELLTRRKPLSKKKVSLAKVFQEAVKEGCLVELIDSEIMHEDNMVLIHALAGLASQCLVMTGESRPMMRQVAEELRRLAGIAQQCHGALQGVNTLMVSAGSALDTSEYYTGGETTDYYSLRRKASMSIEFPR